MRRTIAIGFILNLRKKQEAVGVRTACAMMWVWTKPLPFEISLLDSEAPLCLLRSRKPQHEAHVDCSQFELSTWCSSGKKKLSQNLATSNNASLTSCGHWSLDHVPSQRIIHHSIKFVTFALGPVFWHFWWIQKWLQDIQGPCGSLRKFSIKIIFC